MGTWVSSSKSTLAFRTRSPCPSTKPRWTSWTGSKTAHSEWDMYVDLPENTVRYCFRTFGRCRIFRTKVRKCTAGARNCRQRALTAVGDIKLSCRPAPVKVTATTRFMNSARSRRSAREGHSIFDEEWLHVYCFEKREDAEKFQARFGGEEFDPRQRGEKGKVWARWEAGLSFLHIFHVRSCSPVFGLIPKSKDQAHVRCPRRRRQTSRPIGTSHRRRRCWSQSDRKTASAFPKMMR